MKKVIAIAALAGAATVANAQSMKFYWTVDGNRTNNYKFDNPGDSASISLWTEWNPSEVGFAGSIFSIADLSGNSFFGTNGVDTDPNNGNGRNPNLSALSGDNGTNQGDRLDLIDTFQLPPFFNPGFDASNPMLLYTMGVTAGTEGTYSLQRVAANNGTFTSDVYIDTFGSSVPYQADDNKLNVTVSPTPSSAVLLGVGGLVAARRRR